MFIKLRDQHLSCQKNCLNNGKMRKNGQLLTPSWHGLGICTRLSCLLIRLLFHSCILFDGYTGCLVSPNGPFLKDSVITCLDKKISLGKVVQNNCLYFVKLLLSTSQAVP